MITGLLWLDSLTTAQEARQASSDDCSRGCHCRSSAGKQKQVGVAKAGLQQIRQEKGH